MSYIHKLLTAVLHKIEVLQGAKAFADKMPAAPPQQPHSKNHPLGTAQLSPRSSNRR
ncbi:hypothetical protein [Porphyromonas sp.]